MNGEVSPKIKTRGLRPIKCLWLVVPNKVFKAGDKRAQRAKQEKLLVQSIQTRAEVNAICQQPEQPSPISRSVMAAALPQGGEES